MAGARGRVCGISRRVRAKYHDVYGCRTTYGGDDVRVLAVRDDAIRSPMRGIGIEKRRELHRESSSVRSGRRVETALRAVDYRPGGIR